MLLVSPGPRFTLAHQPCHLPHPHPSIRRAKAATCSFLDPGRQGRGQTGSQPLAPSGPLPWRLLAGRLLKLALESFSLLVASSSYHHRVTGNNRVAPLGSPRPPSLAALTSKRGVVESSSLLLTHPARSHEGVPRQGELLPVDAKVLASLPRRPCLPNHPHHTPLPRPYPPYSLLSLAPPPPPTLSTSLPPRSTLPPPTPPHTLSLNPASLP